MFSTTRQKILLGVYVFILLSIPLGAYLTSQTQIFKSNAFESKKPTRSTTKSVTIATTSAAQQLLNNAESDITNLQSKQTLNPTPTPSPYNSVATSFGPTLSLKVALEGRSIINQATKLFVGIFEGTLTNNPKFLLSFAIDLPASGQYSDLSLAGLNPGIQYTALLKGSSQIATSSAFVMSPTVSSLNEGQAINMLTGDLNEDNVINTSDTTILQKAYGTTPAFGDWNENADFNKDGIINSFDLAILTRNLGRTGASGAWTSSLLKTASSSASLIQSPPAGSPDHSSGGYWIWVPSSP